MRPPAGAMVLLALCASGKARRILGTWEEWTKIGAEEVGIYDFGRGDSIRGREGKGKGKVAGEGRKVVRLGGPARS